MNINLGQQIKAIIIYKKSNIKKIENKYKS